MRSSDVETPACLFSIHTLSNIWWSSRHVIHYLWGSEERWRKREKKMCDLSKPRKFSSTVAPNARHSSDRLTHIVSHVQSQAECVGCLARFWNGICVRGLFVDMWCRLCVVADFVSHPLCPDLPRRVSVSTSELKNWTNKKVPNWNDSKLIMWCRFVE